MKTLFRIVALPLLSSLIFFTSCRKEELVSEELIREFRLDTIFYTDVGIEDFQFAARGAHGDPVITDDYIYFMGLDGNAPAYKLFKADASNGEILWTWNSYQNGDSGYPVKLEMSEDGRLLLVTTTNAYVMDAGSGALSYIFSPKGNDRFGGAALFEDELLASVYNTDSGSRLDQVALDGSAGTTLKTLRSSEGFAPRARSVNVVDIGTSPHIIWEVEERSSSYPVTNIYFSSTIDSVFFEHFSLGSGDANSGILPLKLLTGTNDMDGREQLFVLNDAGLVGAFDLLHHEPIRWTVRLDGGDRLLQNHQNLYVDSYGEVAVFDKATGDRLGTTALQVQAVTDEYLVASYSTEGESGIRIHDSETLRPLQEFSNEGEVRELFRAGEDSFFFADRYEGGRIGMLRIIPLN